MSWSRKIQFWIAYLSGNARWDTGVTPPELQKLITSGEILPGRAVDLGCGTGVNALYLARFGWQVTGVDTAAQAVVQARQRVSQAPSSVRALTHFVSGDVTDWHWARFLFDFALDIGCLHSLSPGEQTRYASQLARNTTTKATFLLYARNSYRLDGHPARFGLDRPRVVSLLAPAFRLVWAEQGQEGPFGTTWYLFHKVEATRRWR